MWSPAPDHLATWRVITLAEDDDDDVEEAGKRSPRRHSRRHCSQRHRPRLRRLPPPLHRLLRWDTLDVAWPANTCGRKRHLTMWSRAAAAAASMRAAAAPAHAWSAYGRRRVAGHDAQADREGLTRVGWAVHCAGAEARRGVLLVRALATATEVGPSA